MKDIAIFGAGGFGKEVACLIKRINEKIPTWNLIGFFDDNPVLKGKKISHFGPCFGGIDVLNSYPNELAVSIALGNSNVVQHIVENIHNKNITFPNLVDVTFYKVDPATFTMGYGNIIQGQCCVSCDVNIGNFNVMNGNVDVGHDATIGSYNTFMPAVRVSGGVVIGSGNFFGINSIVLQQIKIGNHVRLGAGSVLMTKPKDGCTYIGNPAKLLKL